MKICSPQLGLAPNSTLGGEVYDREVLVRFAKMGHQVEVLLPKNLPYDRSVKNLNVEFAPIKRIFPAYLYSLIIIPYLFKKYKEIEFDVLRIHVHFLALGALFFKFFHQDVPIVAHYHLDENSLLFNLVNKFFLPRCDLVIADSLYLKKQLEKKFGLPSSKIKVVYCGTDLNIKPGPKDKSLQKKYNLSGKFVFIFMGRLIKRKRPDFLVEVFNRFHKIYPDSALLMFGLGPLANNLKKKIKEFHLKNSVFLLGTTFGREKNKFYNTSDAFILPSENEGFVLVVLEALAAALPIIASNAVSFGESVTNHYNGYLASPYDIDDWVNKMKSLATNKHLCQKMAKNSRQLAETKFSWENTAKQNILLYEKVVKN